MKLIVKDSPGLVRDSRSKAIINQDSKQYEQYMTEKMMRVKVKTMEQDVKELKENIGEVKSMLQQLITSFNKQV